MKAYLIMVVLFCVNSDWNMREAYYGADWEEALDSYDSYMKVLNSGSKFKIDGIKCSCLDVRIYSERIYYDPEAVQMERYEALTAISDQQVKINKEIAELQKIQETMDKRDREYEEIKDMVMDLYKEDRELSREYVEIE